MTRFEELATRLVNDRGMTIEQAYDRLNRDVRCGLAKRYYDSLVDELSLKQFNQTTSNDFSLVSRANKAKKVSKSKNVHHLCNVILYLLTGDQSGLDALQIDNVNKHIQTIIRGM